MGCLLTCIMFDAPARRCCAGRCLPCAKCIDCCCGVKGLPQEVAPLPEEDGDIVEVVTSVGDRIHLWQHEFSRIKEQPWASRTARFNLIYSHGRLEDITYRVLRHFLKCLARRLEINVYLYEWPGFGHSSGIASEDRVNKAIEAAYMHVIGLNDKRVVLMGHSLGCGPTLSLAVRRGERQVKHRPNDTVENKVAGAILKSAFMTSCAVAFPSCAVLKNGCCQCCDLYRNIDRVAEVTVPVMVVHSAADEMMDLIHGQMLWDRLPEECQWEPWWLETEKHAHLPHDARQFFKRLDDFLEELERLDPAEATEDQVLVRSSLKDMPLASTIQEIQLGLFLSQRALLECCGRKCCSEVRDSLKRKVAAMDELCRKAHQWKRAAMGYGGSLATEQVEEELEMILDKVNLYLEGLEQAPSVHDSSGPEVKSPSTQDEANALHVSVHALNLEEVNNEDDSVVDNCQGYSPRSSALRRLNTAQLINLDGLDHCQDMRYVICLKPLAGWLKDAEFDPSAFAKSCNQLLEALPSDMAQSLVVDAAEMETDPVTKHIWCPVVTSFDLVGLLDQLLVSTPRLHAAGCRILSATEQGAVGVRTVMQRAQLAQWLDRKGLAHLTEKFIEARYTDVLMIEQEGLFEEDLDAIGITDKNERAILLGSDEQEPRVGGDEPANDSCVNVSSVELNVLDDAVEVHNKAQLDESPEVRSLRDPPASPPSKRGP